MTLQESEAHQFQSFWCDFPTVTVSCTDGYEVKTEVSMQLSDPEIFAEVGRVMTGNDIVWFSQAELEKSWRSAVKDYQLRQPDKAEGGKQIIARAKEVLANQSNRGQHTGVENPATESKIELTEDLTREVTFEEIGAILSTTIKKDYPPKMITFAGMLLSQTESDQLNVGLQSKSSTGKSYIPIEVSSYFPPNEVVVIASASPTAFFHDRGVWDEERKVLVVNLEGKILVFLDQPHFQLLEKLRPFLSHDKKELEYKITDKSQKQGLRTKNVVIRGFASVFFCTTKQDPDEQEKTRLMLLSASSDQDKLQESIHLISLRKGDPLGYKKQILEDPKRRWLMDRIKGIRQWGIREVIIPNHQELVCKRFLNRHRYLTPRHQRDFPRIFGLIKAHALLNCFNREKTLNGHGDQAATILATQADIDAGFKLYESIADSNELGLSPYMYDLYERVFKPLLGHVGVKREEIQHKYHEVYHEMLSSETLKREILPQLETVGLIYQEPDLEDKRRLLIYPTVPTPISFERTANNDPDNSKSDESNRGEDSGVNTTPQDYTRRLNTEPTQSKSEAGLPSGPTPSSPSVPCPKEGCKESFQTIDETITHSIQKHHGYPVVHELEKRGFKVDSL